MSQHSSVPDPQPRNPSPCQAPLQATASYFLIQSTEELDPKISGMCYVRAGRCFRTGVFAPEVSAHGTLVANWYLPGQRYFWSSQHLPSRHPLFSSFSYYFFSRKAYSGYWGKSKPVSGILSCNAFSYKNSIFKHLFRKKPYNNQYFLLRACYQIFVAK